MSWQEDVVEAWRYLEGRGGRVSIRKAMEIARIAGAKFRDAEALSLLSKFRAAARPQNTHIPAAKFEHAGSIPAAIGQQPGRGFARANKVSLVPNPLPMATEDKPPSLPLEHEETTWKAPPCPQVPRDLPSDLDALKRLAVTFLAAFGNCTSVPAQRKHGPGYLEALAAMRSRGACVADAWRAFADLRAGQHGRPVFGAKAKAALAFLTVDRSARPFTPPQKHDPYANAKRIRAVS